MKHFISALILSCAWLSLPAFAKEILTIYTYESFVSEWGPGAKIKSNFEMTCDCAVDYVAVADGVAMLNRLKLEGQNSSADLVLGLDTNLTEEAAKTGLFAQHQITNAEVNVPNGWNDALFMPFDYGHFAVVYDSLKISNPPTSLDELVNGDPSQKIILQDPRSSTPGLGFILWMKQVYGDKAGAAWAKLRPRILTTTPGWSEAYGLFIKGEAPMVLSYVTSPAYHMEIEKSEQYKAAKFSEGHYLQIEVAGVVAASPELELARSFLKFMLTPDFQDEIPMTNWMMPAGKTAASLPPSYSKLISPDKTLLYSPSEVNENRRAWIDEWLKVMGE